MTHRARIKPCDTGAGVTGSDRLERLNTGRRADQ
jgi:hypothetical protein